MRSLKIISFSIFLLITVNGFSQSITLTNSTTKQALNYNKVSIWADGTIMTDSKVDNVIFIKRNNIYFKLFYANNLNAQLFGANGDDTLDDSEALQAAINYSLKASQDLIIPSGRYYISKTIILPQHFHYSMKNVRIDFSNSTLVLRKDITLFQSDNWNSKADSKMSNGLILGNFEIVSEVGLINKYAISIQDYHQGSKIENVSSLNIKNLLHSRNNYYLELYNINSNLNVRAGKRFLFEGYHGLNKLTKLSAVNSDICYSFEGGMVAALDMQNISIEGCRVGLNFDSEVYNLNLKNSYFENFDIGMIFNNYIHSAMIDNNYVNFLNKENTHLLQYKGLPLNNIFFNRGNTYIGTSLMNLVKNKEDVYGSGISFDLSVIDAKTINVLKSKIGKNIKINNILN